MNRSTLLHIIRFADQAFNSLQQGMKLGLLQDAYARHFKLDMLILLFDHNGALRDPRLAGLNLAFSMYQHATNDTQARSALVAIKQAASVLLKED